MIAFFGLLYLLPIGWSLAVRDGAVLDFVIAGVINAVVGLAVALATRRFRRELKPRDGFLLVTLSWVLMSASATIPLMIALPDLSFTDAYFEAMSGLTTTGSTVLNGLDALPQSINLWRCTLHWLGGIGIIVLAVAVLPLLGVGGMQLYKAETPGPVKDEKLTPRITETAKALWFTYLAITAAGVVGLRVAGMSWFDAICHTFSAIALGGFSTHDASVGWYNSHARRIGAHRHHAGRGVQFLASLPRAALALACALQDRFRRKGRAHRGRHFRRAGRDGAVDRWGLSLVRRRTAAFGFQRRVDRDDDRFRDGGLREVAGVPAGVAAVPELHHLQHRIHGRRHQDVPHAAAGAPGATRAQTTRASERGHADPHRRPLDSGTRGLLGARVHLPVLRHGPRAHLRACSPPGLDLVSSFSAVVGSINNMGPGLGVVGPSTNFSGLSDMQTWICTAAMLIGRLEIFSVLVLFTATFWRK